MMHAWCAGRLRVLPEVCHWEPRVIFEWAHVARAVGQREQESAVGEFVRAPVAVRPPARSTAQIAYRRRLGRRRPKSPPPPPPGPPPRRRASGPRRAEPGMVTRGEADPSRRSPARRSMHCARKSVSIIRGARAFCSGVRQAPSTARRRHPTAAASDRELTDRRPRRVPPPVSDGARPSRVGAARSAPAAFPAAAIHPRRRSA